MATILEKQIVEEGPRNAIVKLAGVMDVSNVSQTPAISLSDFLNNDIKQVLWGLRVDEIQFSMHNNLSINITCGAGIQGQLIACVAGRGELCFEEFGGLIPDKTREAFNGSIQLATAGYVPGTPSNFTIVLELIKLYTP